MSGESQPPTHDIMPVPEGLDAVTLEFVLSHLAQVALDFELSPLEHTIDAQNPESIDEFMRSLEEQIKTSQRESEEKDAALKMLAGLVVFYKNALDQTRDS